MTSRKTLAIAITSVAFALVIAAAYGRNERQVKGVPLGIEVALKKPFYVPAAKEDRTTKILIRVPVGVGVTSGQDSVSAIRLEPKMEGDKVAVRVYAVIGEAEDVRACSDWDKLKSVPVGTYLASLDEEVQLTKLKELGVNMGAEPLTFRVVPKRLLSPVPNNPAGGDCECASCGGLHCCPNPGACLGCGSCGYACCS